MPRLFFSPKRGAVSYADVTSANIVGFQNKGLKNINYNLLVPSFQRIDSEEIDIQEIKLEGGVGDQTEFIVALDADGIADDQYYWLNESQGMEPGWYDNGWNPIEGVTFKQGQGFYIYEPNEVEIKIPFSGQVDMGEQKIPVGLKYSIVGNSSARDLDLQKIKLEGGLGDQTEFIVVLDKDGIADDQYYWLNESQGMEPGWYDNGWNPIEDVTVKAGDGLMIYQPNEIKSFLVLPAIETK